MFRESLFLFLRLSSPEHEALHRDDCVHQSHAKSVLRPPQPKHNAKTRELAALQLQASGKHRSSPLFFASSDKDNADDKQDADGEAVDDATH